MIQHSKDKQIVMYSEEDERQRIRELYKLNILDTEPEEAFDRITRLVARLFHVPISFVSLITEDRQWFKSCIGIDVRQTGRELSLCQYVIATKETLVVPDAKEDERFKHNPLLDELGIRFYAGARLMTKRGHIVGTLCIADPKPRGFSKDDQVILEELANWVVSEMELRATVDQQTLEKEALQKEIKWAGSLQRQLLPKDFTDSKVDMRSLYLPSNLVSGDFYNYHWITEDRLFGYIVDVMGHGVPTALQTSAIRVLFSQALELQLSLKEMVEWVNRASIPFMPENYFFTAFVFEFDFSRNCLTYVSAGINSFYSITKSKGIQYHDVHGKLLGIFKDVTFDEHQLSFQVGDTFIFCSDGFSERIESSVETWIGQADSIEDMSTQCYQQLTNTKLKDDTTALFFSILIGMEKEH